jgi:hypothetical protein
MDAITPAATAIPKINRDSGCLIAARSLADQMPSFAPRVFGGPSVSVPVGRRVRMTDGEEALEFGIVGMPSFSATWIAKSRGTVGWVLPVIA